LNPQSIADVDGRRSYDFYLISLECCSAFGTGGSGPQNLEAFVIGSIAVSLPSITLDVRWNR
jgi:hypothetical protein